MLAVRLDGLTARQGPMTWGQKTQYIAIEISGDEAYRQNLVRSVPVPPGVETDRIPEALERVLAHHEALRTYFGRSADAGFWQRVAPSVELPLLIFDAADEREVVAARLELARHTFDHAAELPVRFAVVHHQHGVRSVELVVSHVATDAAGADVLAAEVGKSLAGEALLPAPQRQPVDRAAWEGSPAGLARSARNVDRWRTLMETGETRVPTARDSGCLPRFWRGRLASVVLAEALPALAAKVKIPPSALILAGMAQVVAEEFGLESVPVRIGFNNRIDPEDKVAIESLMGWGLCHLTGLGGDPIELGKSAATEAFRAYATASYDIYDVLAVADRLRSEGAGENLPQFFLNVIDLPPPAADPGRNRDRWPELQQASAFDAMPSHTRDSSGLFILQVTKEPGIVQLSFLADTRLRLPSEVEQILRRIEGWLVSLALAR